MTQPPVPPPFDPDPSGPRFVAHDGRVWRQCPSGWWDIDPDTCERLLANLRADAEGGEIHWRRFSAVLADQLQAAINDTRARKEAA